MVTELVFGPAAAPEDFGPFRADACLSDVLPGFVYGVLRFERIGLCLHGVHEL